jgi:hypothetical protein
MNSPCHCVVSIIARCIAPATSELWQAAGIDPIKIARKLWKDTRIDEGRSPTVRRQLPPQIELHKLAGTL